MSSRIAFCPCCRNIGQCQDVVGEHAERLVDTFAPADGRGRAWTWRVLYCPACETPFLQAWPAGMLRPDRLELVGLPRDLLEIEPEGGGR